MSSESSQSSAWLSSETVSVNVYGELYTLNQPIVSINDDVMEHAWLAAHPSAALRVVTEGGGVVTIGKSKDFGNAT